MVSITNYRLTPAELQCRNFLSRTRLFRDLNEEYLTLIARHVEVKRYRADDPIVHQGDPVKGLCIVHEGLVRVTRRSFDASGRQWRLRDVHPSDHFGEIECCLPQTTNPSKALTTAMAVERSRIYIIDKPSLWALMQEFPIAERLIWDLAGRFKDRLTALADFLKLKPKEHLCKVLLDNARAPTPEDTFQCPVVTLTDKALAGLVEISRENINAYLKELVDDDLIERERSGPNKMGPNRKIYLKNEKGLKDFIPEGDEEI